MSAYSYDQRLVDLVEVTADVITLVVEDKAEHVERRVILEGAEVA